MLALACAIITGICFALSLPPYNLEWLMWFGAAPLFVTAVGKRPLEAVGMGLIVCLVAALVQVQIPHSRDHTFLAYYPFVMSTALFVGTALGVSLSRCRCASLPGTEIGSAFLAVPWCGFVAAFAVVIEWLTAFMPMPANVAITQYRQAAIIQIASLTGIWGVSFLIWFTNAAIADVVLTRLYAVDRTATAQRTRQVAVVTMALWLVVLGYGAIRLRPQSTPSTVRVAAIQDCTGDETGDLAPVNPHAPAVDREAMTRAAVSRGARMVVWSEECLGSAFQPDSKRDDTVKFARSLGVYLVVGYSTLAPHHKMFNCAGLIAPDGRLLAVHHKMSLYAEETHTIEPGKSAVAVATPIGKIGMEICFDTCNTLVTRQLASGGAQILLVPNYDPPTVRGVLHNLHAALAPFRCVENAIPMVRGDSNGDSQVIDSRGRVLAQGPLYAPATLVVKVPLGDGKGTPFTRFGDWFEYGCVMLTVEMLANALWKRARPVETDAVS